MIPSEIFVLQWAIVNFHHEIVKPVFKMVRTIRRGVDIIIERIYDCDLLLFKIANEEPVSIDTLIIISQRDAQGAPTFPVKRTYAE